ncbi:tyrosine-type recombinase/integrase [Rhizobium sp. C4]|uniref:tyrosine-type recombinase/integrase n=1 Tax=Rhizobium sp. C4 TaxID=1349800 RepID=UPI001E53BD6A|nr:tyrosine-type recombinase/integrase [Rhizobium sp. C4]MCD2174346.1 tyrosine-type recombinase/integrase [Rhizobium sp. C4]
MSNSLSGPVLARAEQLDALDAILPFDRRDQLAALLTDEDVATLKHLATEGMGENTLRAFASDLGYLEAWCMAATEGPLPWPAPQSLVLKFIAHHLWDPARREIDPAHGMPADVEAPLRSQGLLRATGPHAPATVKRRLTTWSVLTKWRGLEGDFLASSVRAALRLAVRAQARPRGRKSQSAITGDVLSRLLATCATDRLADLRDRALLLTAFASGGRRRSELAALRVDDLIDDEPVHENPNDPNSRQMPCMILRLGRTKTTAADEDARAVMVGRPVAALKAWLAAAGIETGPVFRRIDQWGNIDRRPLTPQAVNLILKSRCEKAGLDPAKFSAHGLRAGYLTEAANLGVPLQQAMQQSQHRSLAQAASYYNDENRRNGKAARVVI